MTPAAIKSAHHATILRNNRRFVHWLAPLDQAELDALLDASDYARQCLAGDAVLFGYDAHGAYRHKRVDWLCERLDHVFYIDRIIIGPQSQGRGLGRRLYDDVADYARSLGHTQLACEVNTRPDNLGSHAFHLRAGFHPIGDVDDPGTTSVRFYLRKL